MKSMTAYAKLNYEDENFIVNMEIKSVNNKNLSLKIRLPYSLNSLENFVRMQVASLINRGSVDLRIEIENKNESSCEMKYDKNLAKSCMDILDEMEFNFQAKFSNKMDFLVKNFGVISKSEMSVNEVIYKKVLEENLDKLLKNFVEVRKNEGDSLKEFFKTQLLKLKNNLTLIKDLRLKVVENYKEKLLQNVELIKNNINLKEEDILKEILIFSDRVDITEEIHRLESHFKQLDIEFEKEEAQGKKIEFIFQEIFREFNTMGVKANMYEISKLVVENKNELEKMREQIMNIE